MVPVACVRDCSGKPTATRDEWRGLGTESPTRRGTPNIQNHTNITLINYRLTGQKYA